MARPGARVAPWHHVALGLRAVVHHALYSPVFIVAQSLRRVQVIMSGIGIAAERGLFNRQPPRTNEPHWSCNSMPPAQLPSERMLPGQLPSCRG